MIASGNTFMAKFWSDGKADAPMLPEKNAYGICSNCNKLFWISHTEVLESLNYTDQKRSIYPNARYCLKPSAMEYVQVS